MRFKRVLACLCASIMMAASFTACSGSEESSSKADSSSSEAATEAATEAAATEAEADANADANNNAEANANANVNAEANANANANAQVNAIVVEDSVVAESGDAYLAFADARWTGYYWGTDADTLTYAATNAKINGNGQYTVALDASTNGFLQTTGYSDMQGLTFAALIVKDGTTLYPNMVLTIDSIKLDGKEIEMTAKPYTSSDDGVEMRSNIYNGYVPADSIAADARTADGDLTGCSPHVVNTADFGNYQKIEVTFTVSGL